VNFKIAHRIATPASRANGFLLGFFDDGHIFYFGFVGGA
jgi:hypothetical protein